MTVPIEERLLEAEAVADEIAAYLDEQTNPRAPRWNDPRAICDMLRALIKSIRLGLIADPESVTDLVDELSATLKSAQRWMRGGGFPSMPPVVFDDDLPASKDASPHSQRATMPPPPGHSANDLWANAPRSEPAPSAKKKP